MLGLRKEFLRMLDAYYVKIFYEAAAEKDHTGVWEGMRIKLGYKQVH